MKMHLVSVLLVGSTLTGCSSVKESLGMSSAHVDTYMIEPHDLTLPPHYKARPPKDGEAVKETTSIPDHAVEDVLKKS